MIEHGFGGVDKELGSVNRELGILKWQFGAMLAVISGFCGVSSNRNKETHIHTDTRLFSCAVTD